MMVGIGNVRIMEILSHATNTIAEGEVQQLANLRNLGLTEQTYLQVISRKTAMLFQAAAHAGAVLARANKSSETALRDYGFHLGLAFQLIDDVLDYEGNSEELGKNIGDDVAEGKITLPLIIALKNGKNHQTSLIRETIESGGTENLRAIVNIVNDTGGITYTLASASSEKDKALTSIQGITSSIYRSSMENLIEFVIQRPV